MFKEALSNILQYWYAWYIYLVYHTIYCILVCLSSEWYETRPSFGHPLPQCAMLQVNKQRQTNWELLNSEIHTSKTEKSVVHNLRNADFLANMFYGTFQMKKLGSYPRVIFWTCFWFIKILKVPKNWKLAFRSVKLN